MRHRMMNNEQKSMLIAKMMRQQHVGFLLGSAGLPGLDPVTCCRPLTSDLGPDFFCTSGTGFLQKLTSVYAKSQNCLTHLVCPH